jgi:hypothetical protein
MKLRPFGLFLERKPEPPATEPERGTLAIVRAKDETGEVRTFIRYPEGDWVLFDDPGVMWLDNLLLHHDPPEVVCVPALAEQLETLLQEQRGLA